MKNGKVYAVMLLTAVAISLPGCSRANPAVEAYLERTVAAVTPTAEPVEVSEEQTIVPVVLPSDAPGENATPTPVLEAQETSPPKMSESVAVSTAKPAETKICVAEAATPTIAPSATEAPGSTATPAATESPRPTATPKPTATPSATATPKPTSTPMPSMTPKPTSEPTPTATPAPTASQKPEVTPLPTAAPTPTPHIHDWTMHEATGHYESQKVGTEEVAVGTYWEEIGGWDEDRAAYYQCNNCGATFASNLSASEHITSAYHTGYSYYPAETVHHDGEWVQRTKYETRDVYEDVWVVDSEACWSCACGETQYTQP